MNPETITINGVEYVAAGAIMASPSDGLPYVIIRTYSAGVHAGYLKLRVGKEVELVNSRRIWYWDGAASLSELAVHGTSKPENCQVPTAVPSITLTEAIEIIPCTEKAKQSIQGVPVWTKR